MTGALTSRRLPGFRFETQAATPADVLPRMDIAVFVGFAGTGPVHLPVPIESSTQFERIFGRDLPLALSSSGSVQYAHLAPAIRDFFRQGGRRCWIIRVAAAHAATSTFPIPGVVRRDGTSFAPAFAAARSPGSGFDSTQVATALNRRTIEVVDASRIHESIVRFRPGTSNTLNPGDTLRLTYHALGIEALGAATAVAPVTDPTPGSRSDLAEVHFATLTWLAWPAVRQPSRTAASVVLWTSPTTPLSWTATPIAIPDDTTSSDRLDWPSRLTDRNVRLALTAPQADLPPIGSMLTVTFPEGNLFLRVDALTGATETGSPLATSVVVTGEARWLEAVAPMPPLLPQPTAESLTLEIRTRSLSEPSLRLTGLGFTPEHSRCWNRLPSDALLFADPGPLAARPPESLEVYSQLWRAAAEPRFPLAGDVKDQAGFLPILVQALPVQWLGPTPTSEPPLVRDGLDTFSASLFLDTDLVEPLTPHLAQEADFIRFESRNPRPLTGIHAAFSIEEATLLAVPDAVHPGWSIAPSSAESPGSPPAEDPPDWGQFLPCGLRVPSAPVLRLAEGPDSEGTSRLAWSHTDPSADAIEVVESALASFAGATAVYRGPGSALTLFRRSPGTYYYAARSWQGTNAGAWSSVLVVPVTPSRRWQVNAWSDPARDQLVAIQRSALRLAAARGDVFAVLTLPEAWRETEALEHVATLRSLRGPVIDVAGRACLSLSDGEAAAFSYGALYHPWLIRSDTSGELRRVPPDGALTGVMAHKSLTRGAWIAPANDALAETLGLEPRLDRASWLSLQEAQINFLRQDAYGFRCLAADTLSTDGDLRPVNVRRLLQLLRRLALRHGATYTFEPHSDAFQRTVQYAFEALLLHLFARGAFAGRSPAAAFQVDTGPSVNPPASRDLGRFIVEIRVAPALPMRFLTLRLVQTGGRAEVTETR